MRGGNIISYPVNLGWLALVLAGTGWIAYRARERGPVDSIPIIMAAHTMRTNHLVQAADLIDADTLNKGVKPGDDAPAPSEAASKAIGELTGRYLVAPIARGKAISKNLVSERPALSLDGGAVGIALAVARKDATAGTIDAGTEVLACSGRKAASERSYRVEAVMCTAGNGSCVGIIRLDPGERQDGELFGPGLAPRLSTVACDSPER